MENQSQPHLRWIAKTRSFSTQYPLGLQGFGLLSEISRGCACATVPQRRPDSAMVGTNTLNLMNRSSSVKIVAD